MANRGFHSCVKPAEKIRNDEVDGMDNDMADLVFILDRSASMEGLEEDTIRGFNSMLKKQVKPSRVTTVLFDDKTEELYYRKELRDVREMTGKEYFVRGCTALLDAIGKTIYKMDASHRKREGEKSDKVIFVIVTDGLENASCEYTYAAVKKLIEKQKKTGWEFFFLGANMDAVREAANIGISSDRSVTFHSDSAGTTLNYKVIGRMLYTMQAEFPAWKEIDASWKYEIEDDYNKRRTG